MDVAYSQGRLERVRRAAMDEARRRPAKGEMRGGDGVLVRRIPKEAYFNAVVHHGVDPRDEGYWSDMARRYPEVAVSFQGKPMVGADGACGGGGGRLTRFGRVTFHKRYGNGT